ncbi:sigma-70 family RNA polymerase sigma factor [Streptomyces sp.]|uniref:RNA polymerase sigma factor n=1 Tax=Streptomyces sp. TaxID=1931 RepID=UPI002D78F237|nr:sigma-70 family RNA polymerase sigma factor [Streptomyces sp.]HET6354620.1 sigma-70 family RNA polymerase sigma factor [Streptomyces sp.]
MTPEHQDPPSKVPCLPSESMELNRPTTADDFFTTHLESLEGYAFRLCRSPETAREVVQDTYLATAKYWPEIEHPEAWVRRVIRNKLIKMGTRDRREISSAEFRDEVEFLGQAVTPTPEDMYAAKETELLFREAVAGLTDEQRLLLTMKMNDLRYEEIAATLNKTEAATRTAWYRLGTHLRRILGVPEQPKPGIRKGTDSNDGKEVKA